MTSRHQTTRIQARFIRLLKRCPAWLQIDYSLINNAADLQFQLEHEIDLHDDGEQGSIKTKTQVHQIKMLLADVCQLRQDEAQR